MDSTLTKFIAHTGADPGLARDILEDQQWDLSKALQAYHYMKGLIPAPNCSGKTNSCPPSSSSSTSSSLSSAHIYRVCRELPVGSGQLSIGHVSTSPSSPPAVQSPSSSLSGSQSNSSGGGMHAFTMPRMQETPSNSPARPALKKIDAVEIDESSNKKLTRGISRATDNVNLVSKARSEFALDFRDSGSSSQVQYFVETPVYTFTLPDLTIYSDEFRAFLEKDLIETSTLVSLEQAGRLNWWADSGACQRLWPLATTGDGNCLLHAASLGMWGFHDRLLTLRKALHATLTNGSYRSAIWRRWRWQQTLQNREAGLVYCEEEWQREWENLLRLSSTEPRSRPGRKSSCCDSPATKGSKTLTVRILDTVSESDGEHDIYESLEEIHVLALAHVLRRPIIVVADTMLKDVTGEPFAPIPFGGIYLPLECPPHECHKSPLVLTYDAAHFSALVAMEKESYADKTPQPPAVIPLTDPEHQLLPVQFAVDPSEDFHWGSDEFDSFVIARLKPTQQDMLSLLHEYLDVVQVPIPPDYLSPALLNGHADDKKSSGGSFESDDSLPSTGTDGTLVVPGSKTKAAKQLQSVAKQFGSIGRTMSKKLKKNLGTLTRIGRSNSFKETSSSFKYKDPDCKNASPSHQFLQSPKAQGKRGSGSITREQDFILAAVLHTEKRHEYQEEMIRNYLHTAHERFERDLRRRQQNCSTAGGDQPQLPEVEICQSPTQCINPGCNMFGTAATSYLCSSCYIKQKQQEQELQLQQQGTNKFHWSQPLTSASMHNPTTNTLYGTGKSRFYAESDTNMFANIAKMPVTRRPSPNQDQTLYLSKSTFYNDVNTPSSPRLSSKGAISNCIAASHEIATIPVTSTGSSNAGTQTLQPTSFIVTDSHNHSPESDSHKPVSPTELNIKNFPSLSLLSNNSKFPNAVPHPCKTPKCQFFGSEDMDFLCSQCYKEQKQKMNASPTYIVQQLRTTHI